MSFIPNKTPIEIIKEGDFGDTYFINFILVLMRNGTKLMERICSFKKY